MFSAGRGAMQVVAALLLAWLPLAARCVDVHSSPPTFEDTLVMLADVGIMTDGVKECKGCTGCNEVEGEYCVETAAGCIWLETPKGHARNEGPGCADPGYRVCEAGTHAEKEINSLRCLQCEAGRYSFEGASECTLCSAGHEAVGDGTNQTACEPGQYNPKRGGFCQQCESGRFSPHFGAHNCHCAPGGHGTNADRTGEVPCAPGEYNREECGSCKPCETGKYSSIRGAHDCQCAKAGHHVTSDGKQEVACAPGSHQPFPCGAECLTCEPGKYAWQHGEHNCKCAERGHTVNHDFTGVVECGPGYYAPEQCTPACIECPAGKYSPHQVSSDCTPAPEGAYQDVPGQTAYKRCEPGTYSDAVGLSECKSCSLADFSGVGETSCQSCFRISFLTDDPGGEWKQQCIIKVSLTIILFILTACGCKMGCVGRLLKARENALRRKEARQVQMMLEVQTAQITELQARANAASPAQEAGGSFPADQGAAPTAEKAAPPV